MHDLSRRDYRRILIIKPSSFGDVIHALPVLNGLRRRYPQSHIAWLVATGCAGLLEGHRALDEIIPFDRRRFGMLGRSFRVSVEFTEFVHRLRGRGFDLVIDLQGLFRSGFLAWATGARCRVGFGSARELAWMFYTHRVAVPDPDAHAVDRYYLVSKLLGFADVPVTFDLPIHAEARRSAREHLEQEGLGPAEPYAVIAPGTRWPTKRWPEAHFAEVVRALASHHGLRPVLIGMASEAEIARNVAQHGGSAVINLAGRTALPELIALIDGATIAVMHDSGPMHLATALGKPMVALYGPTSPARTGPYRRPETVARLDLDCAPCYLKKLADCPHQHRCLRELTPATILERVEKLLTTEVRSS